VVAVVVGAGCGVPTDGPVRLEDPVDVPFGLLDDAPPSVAGPIGADGQLVEVFLVSSDGTEVVSTARRVADPSAAGVVAEVGRDVPPPEAAAGLRSVLEDRALVLGVTEADRLATIDVAPDFTDLAAAEQLRAVAQLVLTATARPDVDAVRFLLDGADVEVPRGDGSLTREPLAAVDFPRQFPEP